MHMFLTLLFFLYDPSATASKSPRCNELAISVISLGHSCILIMSWIYCGSDCMMDSIVRSPNICGAIIDGADPSALMCPFWVRRIDVFS